MLRIIIDYASFKEDIHFLQYKQDYIHDPVWKVAFYVHVFTSIITLMAGFTQFSTDFLQNHRSLHRVIGRLYAVMILFVNFPAGMILAANANGLLPSRIAFIVLDCLWFFFTAKAVLAARRRQFNLHKQYMIRSYALTFSAITLRSWKIVLSHTVHPDPLTLYMIDAWMGFVPNLLFAEWLIRRGRRPARSAEMELPLNENIFVDQVNQHSSDDQHADNKGQDANWDRGFNPIPRQMAVNSTRNEK